MHKLLTASAAAIALAGMTLGAAAPAEARYHGGRGYSGYHYGGGYGYHGGYYRGRGDRTALALGAGVLGLAAGAAIAGSNRGYNGYGYDTGYGYAPGYYGDSYAGAYGDPYGYDRGPVCRSDLRWDRYTRRYVRVEYCD